MSPVTMGSSNNISELAKQYGVTPSQVLSALQSLGVVHEGDEFLADSDELELIKDSLESQRGKKILVVQDGATPRDIAQAIGVPPQDVVKNLMMKLKTMAQLTTSLKPDIIEKVAELYGCTLQWGVTEAPKPATKPIVSRAKKVDEPAEVIRPPVVTIMGHVDHGKTSLLDYIRKANVADKEHGGITQHIGAYQAKLDQGLITFLDTPGHAAFTAMRARGAQVTDIAILVVAADDGIMPQTIEAIGHIKNAGVPMIVAVNKIDKGNANPDRVLMQLTEHEVVPEAYGGQIITCPVSAHTGEGVPHLLEMILLQAEVMELKANPKGEFKGIVIEAKLDKGRGPVATILVQEGTLKIGSNVVVGTASGKIKAMTDYLGERVNEAGPSMPVEILGLSEVPMAGEIVEVALDERAARNKASDRSDEIRKQLIAPKRKISLRDLRRQLDSDETKSLNLIVKADVQGSVEAVRGMLEKIQNEEVEVKIVYAGVGAITESDVLLASASDSIIVGFNVKPEGKSKSEAERAKVEIRAYTIIYELIEDIEAAVKGMLAPKFEEKYLGSVDIRATFKLTKAGFVAGCYVTDGMVKRGCLCRVDRAGERVYEGKIESLKHIKNDVREMSNGQECGIQFENWTAFKEGDKIEAYEMVQIMD